MEIDQISDRLLHQFYFPDTNSTAVRETGDGDCLFSFLSILLIGTEALAVELDIKLAWKTKATGNTKIPRVFTLSHQPRIKLQCSVPNKTIFLSMDNT